MRNLHIGIDRILISAFIPVLLFIIGVLFISCKPGDTIVQDQLDGKWEIYKAERNGKETSYLRRGYFNIDAGGMMTINITGADEQGAYILDRNKLIMGEKLFEIQSLKADSMIVKYNTETNSQFVFYMQKK